MRYLTISTDLSFTVIISDIMRLSCIFLRVEISTSSHSAIIRCLLLAYDSISCFWLFKSCWSVDTLRYAMIFPIITLLSIWGTLITSIADRMYVVNDYFVDINNDSKYIKELSLESCLKFEFWASEKPLLKRFFQRHIKAYINYARCFPNTLYAML